MKEETACVELDELTDTFCENEDFAESKPSLLTHCCQNICFNPDGRIIVRNLSAYWLPELRIDREIGGTIYTVTGSYEGTEVLNRKMLRIMTGILEENR